VLGAELSSLGPVGADTEPSPPLTIAFALVKGDRPEAVVRALTEVGVDRIVPLHSARSVVRWEGDRALAAMDRLRRVVRSAGAQCRRTWLPIIEGPATFREVCTWPDVALAAPDADRPVTLRHRTVVVGPEGGWSDEELAGGLPTVGLGPHILRTETAAMVAGALLVAARGHA
jgi:16S rRNA (uracil1498-N3)-methyltransferase